MGYKFCLSPTFSRCGEHFVSTWAWKTFIISFHRDQGHSTRRAAHACRQSYEITSKLSLNSPMDHSVVTARRTECRAFPHVRVLATKQRFDRRSTVRDFPRLISSRSLIYIVLVSSQKSFSWGRVGANWRRAGNSLARSRSLQSRSFVCSSSTKSHSLTVTD